MTVRDWNIVEYTERNRPRVVSVIRNLINDALGKGMTEKHGSIMDARAFLRDGGVNDPHGAAVPVSVLEMLNLLDDEIRRGLPHNGQAHERCLANVAKNLRRAVESEQEMRLVLLPSESQVKP